MDDKDKAQADLQERLKGLDREHKFRDMYSEGTVDRYQFYVGCVQEDTLEPLVVYQTVQGYARACVLSEWGKAWSTLDEGALRLIMNVYGPCVAGVYRHHKGGLYEVVCNALRTDTLTHLVVYRSREKGTLWARSLDNWTELVSDCSPSMLPRFKRIG